MLASLVIVFREVIEAGLIVGIVLAATRSVPRRGWWVAAGVSPACWARARSPDLPGNWGRCSTAPARTVQCRDPAGRRRNADLAQRLDGGPRSRAAREARAVGSAVAAGDRPLTAVAVVVGVAVLRGGSEVVLFLYSILAAGGTSVAGMMLGGAFGVALGAGLSALIYLGLLAVPAERRSVTTGLITLLAAGLAAQAVFFLQQADYLQGLATPLWDTSWLLGDDSILGRLLHTLIGYTATPDAAQLLAYTLVIALMLATMRLVRGRTATAHREARAHRP